MKLDLEDLVTRCTCQQRHANNTQLLQTLPSFITRQNCSGTVGAAIKTSGRTASRTSKGFQEKAQPIPK